MARIDDVRERLIVCQFSCGAASAVASDDGPVTEADAPECSFFCAMAEEDYAAAEDSAHEAALAAIREAQ
mgnify:CR=1 FL=1